MDNFELKIKRSNYLTIFLLFTHIGAIFCVLFLNFPIWLIGLLIILISYSCYINLRPAKKNIWTKNEILEAGLRNDSFISKYLIILNFTQTSSSRGTAPSSRGTAPSSRGTAPSSRGLTAGSRFPACAGNDIRRLLKPVVICPDSADKHNLRELRVFLRNNYA